MDWGVPTGWPTLDALEAGVAFLDAFELLDDALGRAGEDAAVFDGVLDGGQAGVGGDFGVADVADLLLGEAAGQAQGAEHLEVFLVVTRSDAGGFLYGVRDLEVEADGQVFAEFGVGLAVALQGVAVGVHDAIHGAAPRRNRRR